MRRLIAWLYLRVLGLRISVGQQHIADLEHMLSGLVSARDSLDGQITETIRRLLIAQERRDALALQQGTWLRESKNHFLPTKELL